MILKNNEQRKEFLKSYQKWERFHEVPELKVTYYRFKLPTNATIIVTEWHVPETKCIPAHTAARYCLIFDETHIGSFPKGFFYSADYYKEYYLEGISENLIVDYLRTNKCDLEGLE